MFKPETRPEAVHNLVTGVDRYNPQNTEVLEEYLQEQVNKSFYDHFANLAILKLYQFNPDMVPSTEDSSNQRPFTIFQILLLALAHQPFGADFKLALALLSDQMSPAYSPADLLKGYEQLRSLQQSLLSRNLPQAWSQLSTIQSQPSSHLGRAYASVNDFDNILRRSLARDAFQPLFRTVQKERFESWLHVQGKAQETCQMLGAGWSVQGSQVVVPQTPDVAAVAAKKETDDGLKGREGLNLQKLSKLLKAA